MLCSEKSYRSILSSMFSCKIVNCKKYKLVFKFYKTFETKQMPSYVLKTFKSFLKKAYLKSAF